MINEWLWVLCIYFTDIVDMDVNICFESIWDPSSRVRETAEIDFELKRRIGLWSGHISYYLLHKIMKTQSNKLAANKETAPESEGMFQV